MTVRTYTDLLAQIQGLCGVNFASTELPRILALINRRAGLAYKASDWWTRFLHVGEERTVTGNVISFTQAGLADVGLFLRIHRTAPWAAASAQEFAFYVTASGARITAGTLDPGSAFVTYKEAYTPAINTLSEDIPHEFFHYIAYGTYADFLRAEGQQEKAVLADQEALLILDEELINPQHVSTMQMVATKISTNANHQLRNS
jgi:hypothetical protein